jgi:hypothetical protein
LRDFAESFEIRAWEEFKERLRTQAKTISRLTGHKRKQPGRKMMEIQVRCDQMDFTRDEDIAQLPKLLAELRRYHDLLTLDDNRRYGYRPRELCSPNKKNTKRPQYIQGLRESTDSTPATNRQEMEDIALQFYRRLFSTTDIYDAVVAEDFLWYIPEESILNTEETAGLRRPISKTELTKALAASKLNSALGMNGLPFKFWKSISEEVSNPFEEVCRSISDSGHPHRKELPKLLGTLLYKKGDKYLLSNYRLLNVMNTDLRWRATALLQKMMPHLKRFISGEQKAFIQNRQLSDNVMATMMVLEQIRQERSSAIVLALGQEKAYDRVRRQWLFQVLQYIGVPEEIQNSIKYCYLDPVVWIQINKHLCIPVKLECGVL